MNPTQYFYLVLLILIIAGSHIDQRARIHRLQENVLSLAETALEQNQILERMLQRDSLAMKTMLHHQYEIEELKCLINEK